MERRFVVELFAEVEELLFVDDFEEAFDEDLAPLFDEDFVPVFVEDEPPFAPVFVRDPFARERVRGASRTGAATVNVRPGAMMFELNLFQLRRSSTDTPKRSATVISVSPRCTR